MLTYTDIQANRKKCLPLTGLTFSEFHRVLPAFVRSYEAFYPKDRTVGGRPRQRSAGGGRKAALRGPEQKLLFILVYLKTYPLQVVMAELFGLSVSAVNQWIHRLLPVLQEALAGLGMQPERDPAHFAHGPTATEGDPRRIIDGTDRRRQRPKSPEKQALHYTGKKKTHTDKNVVVAGMARGRIGFLSQTYPGRAHDKRIADHEDIAYPPGAVLFKDTGFQGYEPAGAETRQAKKKATRRGTHGCGEAREPEAGAPSGQGGARPGGGETLPRRERRAQEHQRGVLGFGHGSSLRVTQPSGPEPETEEEKLTNAYF
jgi:hypothetical protein